MGVPKHIVGVAALAVIGAGAVLFALLRPSPSFPALPQDGGAGSSSAMASWALRPPSPAASSVHSPGLPVTSTQAGPDSERVAWARRWDALPEGTVNLRVYREDGVPLGGARVRLGVLGASEHEVRLQAGEDFGLLPVVASVSLGAAFVWSAYPDATSNSEGVVTMRGKVAPYMCVCAESSDGANVGLRVFQAVDVADGAEVACVLRLRRIVARGRVIDGRGEVVAGARVQCWGEMQWTIESLLRGGEREGRPALSREDGSWSLPGVLDVTDGKLHASRTGFASDSRSLKPGGESVELVLRRNPVVILRLIRTATVPPAKAVVLGVRRSPDGARRFWRGAEPLPRPESSPLAQKLEALLGEGEQPPARDALGATGDSWLAASGDETVRLELNRGTPDGAQPIRALLIHSAGCEPALVSLNGVSFDADGRAELTAELRPAVRALAGVLELGVPACGHGSEGALGCERCDSEFRERDEQLGQRLQQIDQESGGIAKRLLGAETPEAFETVDRVAEAVSALEADEKKSAAEEAFGKLSTQEWEMVHSDLARWESLVVERSKVRVERSSLLPPASRDLHRWRAQVRGFPWLEVSVAGDGGFSISPVPHSRIWLEFIAPRGGIRWTSGPIDPGAHKRWRFIRDSSSPGGVRAEPAGR